MRNVRLDTFLFLRGATQSRQLNLYRQSGCFHSTQILYDLRIPRNASVFQKYNHRGFSAVVSQTPSDSGNEQPIYSAKVDDSISDATPDKRYFDAAAMFAPPSGSHILDVEHLAEQNAVSTHFTHLGGNGHSFSGSYKEPFLFKLFRWADIMGFFSCWNNRKYYYLCAPPLERLDGIMTTEYERKVYMFRRANVKLFLCATGLIGYTFYYYRNARQPLPQPHGLDQPYRAVMGMFSSLPLMYPKKRCPHCRIYDPECKMACFEKLRAAGHKMFLDDTRLRAWSTPRINLKASNYVQDSAENTAKK